jgi:hypothetical protein
MEMQHAGREPLYMTHKNVKNAQKQHPDVSVAGHPAPPVHDMWHAPTSPKYDLEEDYYWRGVYGQESDSMTDSMYSDYDSEDYMEQNDLWNQIYGEDSYSNGYYSSEDDGHYRDEYSSDYSNYSGSEGSSENGMNARHYPMVSKKHGTTNMR